MYEERGRGGGGGERYKHQDDRGVSRARKILLLVPVGMARRIEDLKNRALGGHRFLSPSTNTRAKYCQPHRSGGEHDHNHHQDTGKVQQEKLDTGHQSVRADGG